MDLTFVQDEENKANTQINNDTNTKVSTNTILGVCEHHSRLAVSLTTLKDKASITILRAILDAIEQKQEKPKIIRTDRSGFYLTVIQMHTMVFKNKSPDNSVTQPLAEWSH